MTSLLWFTRDLRVHDQPALGAALASGGPVVPVFCLDERLLRGRHASGARTQFMLECLANLRERLGGTLLIRRGDPARELAALARETGAGAVHASADSGPFARRRLAEVSEALGGRLVLHPGLHVVDRLEEIRTQAGRPYTVFTPFYRNWLGTPRREPLGPPASVPVVPPGLDPGRIPALDELELRQEVATPPPGGESAGRQRLQRFLDQAVRGYAEAGQALGRDATSRLSPYLHFGCVSAREIEHRLPGGPGAEAYRRQLCWRDFYAHVLLHFPDNARMEFQQRYRGTIEWASDEDHFRAWCEGRTGYPLVDAGMRQLRREGWMAGRVRLVVGSFLTKDLGIDWRRGERWFMRLLVDGDQANNNGNWQWIASVGVDPQPFFRRMYNPARHRDRLDPDGSYVRRFVPELGSVPDAYLSEPWTMPAELQREIGCVIGEHYPKPIVDRRQARVEAFARYRA
jgi:deoxyribodipyrimidine photo-lyase